MNSSERVVLYADDDADDRMLLSQTFQIVAPDVVFDEVADGHQVFNYLEARKENLPCLLILDLNMPGLNGKEIVRRLKLDDDYQNLPVVVFTTSANPADRDECAGYGVDLVTKPIDLGDFERTASHLLSYCQ